MAKKEQAGEGKDGQEGASAGIPEAVFVVGACQRGRQELTVVSRKM